jgi:hypothetical protein
MALGGAALAQASNGADDPAGHHHGHHGGEHHGHHGNHHNGHDDHGHHGPNHT